MRIVFWGTPSYALKSLESINNSSHEIVLVVTQPDKKRSRGKKVDHSPIKKKCLELNLPVITPKRIKEDSPEKNKLMQLDIDLFVVVAFGQILPTEILNIPKYGCWNSHASLLPRWRGAAPIQWSLLTGDKKTGVGIMLMQEGLDTGPIYMQKEIDINETDNAETLSERLSQISANLLVKTIEQIDNESKTNSNLKVSDLNLKSQEDLYYEPKYARMIEKKDLLINWNVDSIKIQRKIMALYPNAYTFLKTKRLKILISESLNTSLKDYYRLKNINDDGCKFSPGQICLIDIDYSIIVKTANGLIKISKAHLEGKKPNSGKSLVQQLDIKTGDYLNGKLF